MKTFYKYSVLLLVGLLGLGLSSKAAPVGGSVVVQSTSAAVDSVCAGTNSKTLELQGYFGTIVRWEYSTTGSNPWISIAHTNATYTVSNLNSSLYLRAVVSDAGITANSSSTFIRVDQPSVAGTLNGNNTVCAGSNSGTISLTGNIGRVKAWMFSFNLGNTWTTNSGITDSSLAYSNLTQTTWYRVIVSNGACSEDTTAIVKVNVKAQTVGGSALIGGSANTTVCSGSNSGTISLSGHTGSVLSWEKASSSNGPWSQIFNNTSSLTYTNLNSTTYYRAIVSNQPCDTLTSAIAIVNVDPATNTGSISGDLVQCVGANSGLLQLTGYTGSVTNWLKSSDSSSWSIAPNPNATLNYSNLTDTTWYRAIVKSGTCSADTSLSVRVDVNPASIGGVISSATVCYQVNSGTLTLTGNTGNVLRWENASNSGGPWSSIVNNSNSLNYSNLISTNYYRAVIQNPGCNTVYSSTSTVQVDPTSNAGNITGVSSACITGNTFTLQTQGNNGTATDWLKSTNNGSTWTSLSNSADTLLVNNQNTETWYRFITKSGVCVPDTSSTYKVKTDPASVGGTMSGSATVCSGNNTGSISVSGFTGSIIRWETAANANGPWSGVTHTSTSLNYNNLTNSVYYRAIVKSGECTETPSDSAYIEVEPKLAGGSISGSATGCEGENNGALTLNNYGGSISKWQFSENNGTSWTDSITSARTMAYKNLLKTRWYRVLVQAGVCGSTYSDTSVITIYSEPVVNFTTPQTCQNKAVSFQNQTINGNNNQYSWSFGDGNSSNLKNPNYQYSNHGTFSVTLTALSSDNCSAFLTKSIVIDSVPQLAFTTENVCRGKSITFTNTSTPMGGSSSWSFGDGSNSINTSPTYTYSSEGSYNCSLAYTAPNGCKETLNKTVEIYPQPTSVFSQPKVAEQKAFTFINSSSVTSGSIGYQWNFGDGNSSIVQNPTHIYADTGNYVVSLIAFNSNCRDTLIKTVVSNPVPDPNFSFSNLCQGDSVQFSNTTFIKKGGMSYKWNFDDGSTSSLENPKHRYSAPGNYKVELEVTSDSGFTSKIVKNVNIDPLPIPNFTALLACEGDTTEFRNLSTINGGTLNYIWDFGVSGAGAVSTDAKYRYTTGGTYAVKLIATSSKGCRDSIIKNTTVYYRPIVRWGNDTVCEGSATSFTDSSRVQNGRAVNFNWDFGNNNGSGVRNPTYTYSNYGTYIGKLTVTSDKGCIDSLIKNVIVHALPVPNYTFSNACQRDSINFGNTSFHPLSNPITHKWKFGNGDTSLLTSPRYAFSGAGTFGVTLVVSTTNTGCADSITKNITIYPRSTPSFTVPGVCLGNSSSFSNGSSVSSGTLSYFWDFGDMSTSTLANPNHMYAASGMFTVKLQATTNQNCQDSAIKTVYVWPQPVAKFVTQNVCNGDSLSLTNQSTYSTGSAIPDTTVTYVWDFGDGDTAHTKNIKHLYSNSGNYRVSLTATTDSGCVSTTSKNIEVYTLPIADYEFFNACVYDSLAFKDRSTSVYGSINTTWYFGDNSNSTLPAPKHQYANWGSYTVRLEITDKHGCVDSLSQIVEAYPKPTSSFGFQNVCDGQTSSFSDSSQIVKGTIRKWQWFFDDGTGSTLQHPKHLFLNDGTYRVKLEVESDNGCTDDTTQVYIIYPLPLANFELGKSCLNDPLPLANKASIKTGTLTYIYTFSDGASYQTEEPIHIPISPGTITLKQLVSSEFQCKDSLTRSTEVWQLPEVVAEKDSTVSYGLGFRLKASGAEDYLWEPAASLDNTSIAEPWYDALSSNDYIVYGTDANGCKNSDTIKLVTSEDFQVYPSEIITPDGNGYNDTWIVKNAENYPQVNVQILDRWGNQVFEEKGYQNTWDGRNKNNDILPDGTYYYIVSFEGSSRSYKGALTLIRNKK